MITYEDLKNINNKNLYDLDLLEKKIDLGIINYHGSFSFEFATVYGNYPDKILYEIGLKYKRAGWKHVYYQNNYRTICCFKFSMNKLDGSTVDNYNEILENNFKEHSFAEDKYKKYIIKYNSKKYLMKIQKDNNLNDTYLYSLYSFPSNNEMMNMLKDSKIEMMLHSYDPFNINNLIENFSYLYYHVYHNDINSSVFSTISITELL